MALYRIYVDEVGNHDLTHADDPNQRYLSLTGVILESSYTLNVLKPEMDEIKRRFFQRDPDEPVIFHRKEMVNKRPPFDTLRDSDTEQEFNTVLLSALTRWDYNIVTVVIDKKNIVTATRSGIIIPITIAFLCFWSGSCFSYTTTDIVGM